MVYKLDERSRRQPAGLRIQDGTVRQGARVRRRTPAIERPLAESRASRARIASDIRTLLIRRNEAAAMALADRVPVCAIATAAQIKAADVRRVGSCYTEFDYSGTPARVHLARLSAIASELQRALVERGHAEEQLRSDIEEALNSGQCDVFRVAAVAAVPAERVRDLLRRTV